jgi:hypothetical protein
MHRSLVILRTERVTGVRYVEPSHQGRPAEVVPIVQLEDEELPEPRKLVGSAMLQADDELNKVLIGQLRPSQHHARPKTHVAEQLSVVHVPMVSVLADQTFRSRARRVDPR